MVLTGGRQGASLDCSTAGLGDRPDDAEPLDVAVLARLSPALVVAPHPDDESLGCGGLVALLADAGVELHALLVTDGTASHPRSRRFDVDARRALREAEWHQALSHLGMDDAASHRLGCADGHVPVAGEAGFASATADLAAVVDAIDPGLVLLPWRRDPHPDHRASHALVRAVIAGRARPPRCLEYIVWAGERGATGDWPCPGEARRWWLDISSARDRKCQAIAAHRSQHGEVITDDPTGFVIPSAMRRRAEGPCEHFLETNDWR